VSSCWIEPLIGAIWLTVKEAASHGPVVGAIHAKNVGKFEALREWRRERRVMWGLFVGISLAFALYSFYEGWQRRRVDKKRLADMRENFKLGRHFDVTKGQWGDRR
jgi:hypothetical protein